MERKLSEKYLSRIKSINIEGVIGTVWDRELFLEFLQDAESNHYAILGGDLIKVTDGKMEYTYDNWSVKRDREPTESFERFVSRCKEEARLYIEAYPSEKNILFSPIMTSEVTAGLVKN